MRHSLAWTSILTSLVALGCSVETGTNHSTRSTQQELTVGLLDVTFATQSDWGSGYCTDVILKNQGDSELSDWKVTLDFNGATVGNLWNGVRSNNEVQPVSHNGSIAANSSVSFGFCATGSGRPSVAEVSYEGGGNATVPTCDDGIQNQNETGVDCGGQCSPCVVDPTCDDGIQNQNETGVDCGGQCSPCSGDGGSCDGLQTWVDNNWRLNFTAGEVIEFEGVRYQTNMDVSYPNGSCTPGSADSWCINWFTALGPCGEDGNSATCSDGIQNQNETGVDCGGECSACSVDATCSDGIQNQGESGVDCGGPCTSCEVAPSCDGYATRYWDCCMAHCSWEANVPMSMEPLKVCGADDSPLANSQASSSCDGGNGFQCQSFTPQAVSSTLSYGYAATSSGDVCGRCYEIEFTGQGHYGNDTGSAALAGKKMVVQALNVGYDVSGGQFDLLIPGGGVGLFNACSSQWGVSNSELGAQYGGFLTQCKEQGGSHDQIKSCVTNKCSSVFGSRGLTELEAGCNWFVDWYEAADNPNIKYREVSCPTALSGNSGMDRSSIGDIRTSCN